MKTKNLFKGLLATTLFLVSGTLFAQTYVLPVGVNSIDSATVGSQMGYKVQMDPVVKAFPNMNPSTFDWLFSNGAVVKNIITPFVPLVPIALFYTDTAISATMPVAVGPITLTVHEKSNPITGTGCTDAAGSSLSIQVLPRPQIDFTSPQSNGGCSAATFNIPLNLKGYGPWTVKYSMRFNSGAWTPQTDAIIGAVGNNVGTTAITTLTLDIVAAQLTLGAGTYEVRIDNILDRISLKSLDVALVAGQVADLPITNSYKVYIYPTPGTKPIQHLKNL